MNVKDLPSWLFLFMPTAPLSRPSAWQAARPALSSHEDLWLPLGSLHFLFFGFGVFFLRFYRFCGRCPVSTKLCIK